MFGQPANARSVKFPCVTPFPTKWNMPFLWSSATEKAPNRVGVQRGQTSLGGGNHESIWQVRFERRRLRNLSGDRRHEPRQRPGKCRAASSSRSYRGQRCPDSIGAQSRGKRPGQLLRPVHRVPPSRPTDLLLRLQRSAGD